MKKYSLILFAVLVSVTIFAPVGHCRTTVFFVGGWGMTPAQMESFSRSVPESRKVKFMLPTSIKDLMRPWYCANLMHDYIRKNNLAEDDLYVVAFSLGGVVTQWLLNDHPELRVKKLILVGAPMGGYKFVPPNPFFENDFPADLPIYVIAGSKGHKSLFLREVNDGVVDLKSALDIREQNLRDAAVFHAEHSELESIPEVQAQISQWLDLQQEPPQNMVAGNNSLSQQSQNLGQSPDATVNLHN